MNFTTAVVAVVAKIPRGETLSYAQVAALAGRPRAYRAVGNILNRIWQSDGGRTVPCHRVVRSDGIPGDYAGGSDQKRELLDKEKS